jgi:hypothetical protein
MLAQYSRSCGDAVRPLTDEERLVTLMLADRIGSKEEKDQLLADLQHCSVEETAPDRSLLSFEIEGYQRPGEQGRWQYRQSDGYVVDGVMKDADGSDVDVMLLADANHRIWDFELVRHNPGPLVKPDWSTFKVR